MNVLSHLLIFFFIMWLLEGSLVVPPVFTDHIFLHLILCFCQVHILILFPGTSVLVLRGIVKKIAYEIEMVQWYKWVVLPTFQLKLGKYKLAPGYNTYYVPHILSNSELCNIVGLKNQKPTENTSSRASQIVSSEKQVSIIVIVLGDYFLSKFGRDI